MRDSEKPLLEHSKRAEEALKSHFLQSEFLENETIRITENSPQELFHNAMEELNETYAMIMDASSLKYSSRQFRMIYTRAFTILEAYLSDVIKHLILAWPKALENLVNDDQTCKELSFGKYTLSQIIKDPDFVTTTVLDSLSTVLYHNIPKALRILRAILKKNIEIDIEHICKYCDIRHDLVHRNGKDKDGNAIEINDTKTRMVFVHTQAFVRQIDKQIKDTIGGIYKDGSKL